MEERRSYCGREVPGWCWQVYSWLGWLSLASHWPVTTTATCLSSALSLRRPANFSFQVVAWLSSDHWQHGTLQLQPTQPPHPVVLSHWSDGASPLLLQSQSQTMEMENTGKNEKYQSVFWVCYQHLLACAVATTSLDYIFIADQKTWTVRWMRSRKESILIFQPPGS